MTPNRNRSVARLHALQALFQMEASDQSIDAVREEFETHRFGAAMDEAEWAEGDVDLFRRILEDAVNWQARIDQATDRALVERWPINRIDPTLRALFRAAGAELVNGDVPAPVVINEFVEIAKAFFPGGKEPGLVNAVLDQVAGELRSDRT